MNSSNPPAVKSKDQLKAEIAAAVQSNSVQMLVEALADANLRINDLTAELDKLRKKDE